MAKGKERHMFPGGNTSKVFYYVLLPQEKAKNIDIKGRTWSRKITFMKELQQVCVVKDAI